MTLQYILLIPYYIPEEKKRRRKNADDHKRQCHVATETSKKMNLCVGSSLSMNGSTSLVSSALLLCCTNLLTLFEEMSKVHLDGAQRNNCIGPLPLSHRVGVHWFLSLRLAFPLNSQLCGTPHCLSFQETDIHCRMRFVNDCV